MGTYMGTMTDVFNLESESLVTNRQWQQNHLVLKRTKLISYTHVPLASSPGSDSPYLDIWSLVLTCLGPVFKFGT